MFYKNFYFTVEIWYKFVFFDKIYGPTWKIYLSFIYWGVCMNHPDDLEVSTKQWLAYKKYKLKFVIFNIRFY